MNGSVSSIATLYERTQAAVRLVAAELVLLGALAVLMLWNLGGPPPWWDEGWTLSVARNLAERDHYGRLLAGEPAPGGLEASVVVTVPVAGFFKLFGVGLWQGRLFGVLCALGALAVAWRLAARLYNRRVAAGTAAVLLLLSAHPQLNPVIQGRQVLGELPSLLFALGGYACLLAALRRAPVWLLPAVALWWAASEAKAQFQPFWIISLIAPLAVALLWRRWRAAAIVGLGLALGLVSPHLFGRLVAWGLGARRMMPDSVSGLYEVMALVTQPFNRLFALQILLGFGLPVLLGLAYGAWRALSDLRQARPDDAALVRLSLLALAGSWLAWFALLSVGVPRYMFPPSFVGALFAAALLHDLTGGFDLRATLGRLAAPLRRPRRFPRESAGAWLAALLVAMALPLTALSYQRYYLTYDDHAAERVAALLNERVGPDELIETYESELHFFLDRPYHYPPDQVHVELNRRSLLRQHVAIDYDPLAADPDYLVVGQFARGNGLYEPVLASGAFELMLRDGSYEVYRRVRR